MRHAPIGELRNGLHSQPSALRITHILFGTQSGQATITSTSSINVASSTSAFELLTTATSPQGNTRRPRPEMQRGLHYPASSPSVPLDLTLVAPPSSLRDGAWLDEDNRLTRGLSLRQVCHRSKAAIAPRIARLPKTNPARAISGHSTTQLDMTHLLTNQ